LATQNHAGSFLVEPVHDGLAEADRLPAIAIGHDQQRVDECAGDISSPAMNRHASFLIDGNGRRRPRKAHQVGMIPPPREALARTGLTVMSSPPRSFCEHFADWH